MTAVALTPQRRERQGTPAIRVCIVDSVRSGVAYPRLSSCRLEIIGVLPHLGYVRLALRNDYDVAVVGCDHDELTEPTFGARLQRLARAVPTVVVVRKGRADDAAIASSLGARGFVAREVRPEAFTRTVEAASRGELAYPRTALDALVRT